MIIEPTATTTEQIACQSSSTATTAARPLSLFTYAKRQPATPIRNLRLAPSSGSFDFYQSEALAGYNTWIKIPMGRWIATGHFGRVRLLPPTLEATMQTVADRPEAPTAIRTDLGAIFVSLELSRSTWLITSLSPGGGEKMSKQVVRGGDVARLLERFGAYFREKARARTGKVFPFVVIQEAGLDGFLDRSRAAE